MKFHLFQITLYQYIHKYLLLSQLMLQITQGLINSTNYTAKVNTLHKSFIDWTELYFVKHKKF
jgi:hypothetical protein